jgi:SAM-dependent methyltransferase
VLGHAAYHVERKRHQEGDVERHAKDDVGIGNAAKSDGKESETDGGTYAHGGRNDSGAHGGDDGRFSESLILAVLHSVLVHHPKHLRVKELLESVECFRVIESYLMANLKRRGIQRVLDLCCGHGLLGLLIGYRFPHLQEVVCVDIAPSGAFADYKEALARVEGVPVGSGKLCRNVELVTADARDVAITPDTLCVCIHGCNDISKVVLTRAVAGGASYAVMPCCIVDGLYGVAVVKTGTPITDTHTHTHIH